MSEDLSRRRGFVSLTNRSRSSSGASGTVPVIQESIGKKKDGKVSFSDSVFDLASGKEEPLQQKTDKKREEFVKSMVSAICRY